MAEFTPGPWFWPHSNTLAAGAKGDPEGTWTLVAAIHDAGPVTPENARLIAAAPDLYAALDRLTETLGQMPAGKRQRAAMVDAYEAAIAAMNKTTGARAAGPGEDG